MAGQSNASGLLFVVSVMCTVVGVLWFLVTGEWWQFIPMWGALFFGLLAAKASGS
jgi:hypothetical protein